MKDEGSVPCSAKLGLHCQRHAWQTQLRCKCDGMKEGTYRIEKALLDGHGHHYSNRSPWIILPATQLHHPNTIPQALWSHAEWSSSKRAKLARGDGARSCNTQGFCTPRKWSSGHWGSVYALHCESDFPSSLVPSLSLSFIIFIQITLLRKDQCAFFSCRLHPALPPSVLNWYAYTRFYRHIINTI